MRFDIEKIDSEVWDVELREAPYASPFHEYAWNDMIAGYFEYDFQGYVAHLGEQAWLIPIYQRDQQVRSSFIGYGGPLALHDVTDGDAELQSSKDVLSGVKTMLGVQAISGTLYPAHFWPEMLGRGAEVSQTAIVDIDFTTEELFSKVISGNCRTAVRKAAKREVQIRPLNQDECFEQVTALLNQTQQQVGSTYRTEASLLHLINSLDKSTVAGEVVVAELEGKPIAMSTVISNCYEAFHLFSGWDRDYAEACANQALHWRSILKAKERGLKQYNMGESHTPELLAAKLRWGGGLLTVPKLSL